MGTSKPIVEEKKVCQSAGSQASVAVVGRRVPSHESKAHGAWRCLLVLTFEEFALLPISVCFCISTPRRCAAIYGAMSVFFVPQARISISGPREAPGRARPRRGPGLSKKPQSNSPTRRLTVIGPADAPHTGLLRSPAPGRAFAPRDTSPG